MYVHTLLCCLQFIVQFLVAFWITIIMICYYSVPPPSVAAFLPLSTSGQLQSNIVTTMATAQVNISTSG